MSLNQTARVGVQISEKQRSIKYIESSVDEDEIAVRVRTHSSEEFVRLQSTSDEVWSKSYYYLLCSILIGSGHDIFPLAMKFVIQLSGGGFILLLLGYSIILGLPLIYMETFIGRYTKLTNCQMYRMAPIFFGVCFVIYLMNIMYQPMHVTTDTQILVNLLKLLANPNVNNKCLDETKECYDYATEGKIDDKCRYGHISMICEKHGEIRYLMEYQYWKMYKDPTSPNYPYYQIITAVVLTWMLILVIVMKGIQVIGRIIYVAFIVQIIILTLIFLLALSKQGGTNGLDALVKVNSKKFDLYQVLIVQWYSLGKLGLIFPTGYMTSSAYAKFKSNIGTECFIIVACSVALTCYYLAIFFSICGVLANAMGVDVEAVIIPDRGLYLAVVPQFLIQLQMPHIFLVIYYGSLWFFETVKVALYVHMLVLNLYDYFPTLKNFATYIWVTSCLVLCFSSLPAADQYASTVLTPIVWLLYLTIGLGLSTTLEVTMVSYFYGVSRLCDDIHFLTGQKPTRFWRCMWYLIPVIGWSSIVVMCTMINNIFDDTNTQDGTDLGWLYGNLLSYGCIFLAVVSTIMYIAFRFGTPELLLSLLKPQFFWGPPEREVRIERKNFCPQTSIRSQQIYSRSINEYVTIEAGGVLISEFSKDVLLEQAAGGDILNDKNFFEQIGVFSNVHCNTQKMNTFLIGKGRELDSSNN